MGNSLKIIFNMKKIINLFFILFVNLAFSDDLEDAKLAYKDSNFEKAMKIYNKSCEEKNAKGCVMVGFMYERGIGVNQDFTQAIKFYKKHANTNLLLVVVWLPQCIKMDMA